MGSILRNRTFQFCGGNGGKCNRWGRLHYFQRPSSWPYQSFHHRYGISLFRLLFHFIVLCIFKHDDFFYFLYKYIASVYVFYGCIQICLPLYEQEREFFIFISGSWIYYNLKFFWGHCRCWEILRAVQSWWVYVSYFYFLNLGPFFLCLLTLCLMLVVFVFIVLFPSSVFC